MAENMLADLSMDFAVKILKISDELQGHYALKNQLERSATSILAGTAVQGGISAGRNGRSPSP